LPEGFPAHAHQGFRPFWKTTSALSIKVLFEFEFEDCTGY
jgi:hypothetical protein